MVLGLRVTRGSISGPSRRETRRCCVHVLRLKGPDQPRRRKERFPRESGFLATRSRVSVKEAPNCLASMTPSVTMDTVWQNSSGESLSPAVAGAAIKAAAKRAAVGFNMALSSRTGHSPRSGQVITSAVGTSSGRSRSPGQGGGWLRVPCRSRGGWWRHARRRGGRGRGGRSG